MHHYPFPPIWIGDDLHHHRPGDGSFNRYDYRSLPKLPKHLFDGRFSWLRQNLSPLQYDQRFADGWGGIDRQEKWKREAQAALPQLMNAASAAQVVLPTEYSMFMYDFELVTMLRSPIDGYFCFTSQLIPNPGPQGGFFASFFCDSQACYLWYLFLHPKGKCCVVASTEDLTNLASSDSFWENDRDQITFCSGSFEAFIYRLWIENEIWFRIQQNDQPLTDVMAAYLEASSATIEVA